MSTSQTTHSPEAARRKSSRMVLILVAAVLVGFAYGVFRMATYDPNYVIEVPHSASLKLKSGGVRLIGVVPPPVHDRLVGRPAQQFVEACVLRRHIQLEEGRKPEGAAGWILGYVFVEKDGKRMFLNEELLRRGFARLKLVYPNLKYRKQLEAAEAEAKAKKIGVWRPGYKPSTD